ncbi:MAG: BrnA antitoxin family protein [Lamprocystis purpurea]|nr:BrnA antitoxin family protein [Lamprocystis purpurea]
MKAALEERRRTRGPNKRPVKEQVAIRLGPEVLAAFRADGPGWQTRINAVLRQYVEQQRSAP